MPNTLSLCENNVYAAFETHDPSHVIFSSKYLLLYVHWIKLDIYLFCLNLKNICAAGIT